MRLRSPLILIAATAVACKTEVKTFDSAGAPIDSGHAAPAAAAPADPATKPGASAAPTTIAGPPASPTTKTPGSAPSVAAPAPVSNEPVLAPTLPAVDTTVTLRTTGTELAFDPAGLTFKTGTRVKIRLANNATFAHNFIIAKSDDDIDELVSAAIQQGGEHVPMSLKSKMVVWTNMAQPGQTVEASFVVPAPGSYTFLCLVEGHANTMTGVLRSIR